MKQPRRLDYSAEGGPTDSCSPNMSAGRGPRRSVKDLIRRYSLELTAATFLIIDSDPTSLEIACEWQRCMGGQVTCSEHLNINTKSSAVALSRVSRPASLGATPTDITMMALFYWLLILLLPSPGALSRSAVD